MSDIQSGKWSTMSLDDARILQEVRLRARREPGKFEAVLGKYDPKVDRDGNPWWGSYQHLAGVAIRLLVAAVEEAGR
ncbi:MAG: hypothetical protein ABID40_01175 [Candidatus Bipolaricaulota bacterium]